MQLIFEDKQGRIIKGKEEIKFSTFSSYHLILVTAYVKSEKQLGENARDDEDLIVKINDKTFPKLNSNRLKDSPAAFSSGRLHNLAKTVYFLTFLKGKNQTIALETDEFPNTATFESLQVYTLNLFAETLTLEINQQAEDSNRHPWLTFVLDNLPLKSVIPTITYSRRKRDSDDVKVIIDDKTQGNILRTIKHFLWRYAGSLLPRISPTKTETQTFTVNFPQNLHYIEFHADRMPILEKITFDFGTTPPLPEGIPTVDNPKWTGNFYDDTDDVLMARMILGEAERQSKEAKTGIGYTVLNRLKKHNAKWGYSVREIILKERQYDGMWNEKTYHKVKDPLKNASEFRKREWKESHQVGVGVLSGNLKDSTLGVTHFHSYKNPEEFPNWATEKTFRVKLGDIYFYELER